MSDKSGDKEKLPWGLKEVAPGSFRALSQKELEAFEMGTLIQKKKHLSKREQEELRKKQEEEAAAQILGDFVASFENTGKNMPKMFVKGATINPSTNEKIAPDKGNIYTPALKLAAKSSPLAKTEVKKDPSEIAAVNALMNKKGTEKRKSNLELFKEELKRMQMEREKNSKTKHYDNSSDQKFKHDNDSSQDSITNENDSSQESNQVQITSNNKQSIVEDPNTTNIFISNLSQKTLEQDLVNRFGKYGLLASVKIMWPRTDEEKTRSANCGFVAFMYRKDAEQALKELDGVQENGQTMRLSWSKAITIPSKPFYIPPDVVDSLVPPPQSGLPFNAQLQEKYKLKDLKRKLKKRIRKIKRYRSSSCSSSSSSSSDSPDRKTLNKNLQKCLVKVVIPTDRNQLCTIHRMIEYVIKYGPSFEAVIMSREINNPQFRFLFDNQCPGHIYYRWKLYSILNGDSVSKWSVEPFVMFKKGSYWKPPQLSRYTQGLPDETYEKVKREYEIKKGKLSIDQNEEIEEIFRELTTERKSISEAMIYFVENADKAEEIVELFKASFAQHDSPLNKQIARLFVISDILHNCLVKVSNVHYYRRGFEQILPSIFENLNQIYEKIDGKIKSESFKQKVLTCIRAWEDWAIYPNDFLVNLQSKFMGILNQRQDKSNDEENIDEDVDGKPLDDDDEEEEEEESIDGKPIDEIETEVNSKTKFVTSKWETVAPEKLEKQAITTSKWDFFDDSQQEVKNQALSSLNVYGSDDDDDDNHDDSKNIMSQSDDDDDIDGKPMEEDEENDKKNDLKETGLDEEKRKQLREIELKVLKYIDEIENGLVEKETGRSVHEQAEIYRAKLVKEMFEKKSNNSESLKQVEKANEKIRHRSRSSSSSSSSSTTSRKKSSYNTNKSSKKKQRRSSSRSPSNRRSSYSTYNSSSTNRKRY